MEESVYKALKGVSRLGIMGGTFDPIHYGHLVAAETARTEFGLDSVLFIPTGTPPHKVERKVTDAELRFQMVEMCVSDNSYFSISRIELEREGPSYTIDTLRTLSDLFPEQELYFITGTDALKEMFTWREPGEIIKLARIIGASRPGYDASELFSFIYARYPVTRDRVVKFEVPALAISSTDIRQRTSKGKSIRYLLPERVRLFIKENSLYQ